METRLRQPRNKYPGVHVTSEISASSRDTAERMDNFKQEKFHWDIWLILALENWIFDFGRPIAALFVPTSWSPMNKPSIGDYFHMAYNIITPFCILKLLERSHRKISSTLTYLSIIMFVMGASIHLVGDSVNHRLVNLGYQLHMSVRDNPIMQQLHPEGLVDSFELLYIYDEEIGHLMWYIPFFISLLLFFVGCFKPKTYNSSVSAGFFWWLLMVFSAVYYWYLVTEGQIFTVYFITLVLMLFCILTGKQKGNTLDINGKFLFYTFSVTLILIVLWVGYLWNDETLRKKYPGLIYIPEPWSYYTLYWKH